MCISACECVSVAAAAAWNHGLSSGIARICCGKSEVARCYLENHSSGYVETEEKSFGGLLSSTRFLNTFSTVSKSCGGVRTFSSQVGAKDSGEEDDDLDGFSELETPHDAVQEATSSDESDDELLSEGDIAVDDMQNDTETDVGKKRYTEPKAISEMTKAILATPALAVSKVLDKWVEEGNEVTQTEVSITMLHLRKRRMYIKALQLSEWLESTKHIEFNESNYASRVDLIAKVRGLFKAEEYIQQIPESFRGEVVYRTLLANCVSSSNVKKSEDVFNKMKNLKFPVTCFSCNQLLLLYKRTDKKKIADVLLLMEKENIKPSLFTYQLLIDAKGQANDITGMEQIVETMKSQGLEPNTQIRTSLARHYANSGIKDKSEAILKDLEGDNISKNRWVCKKLLPIYATLGREDEVERIWNVCESKPLLGECIAAVEAWGQLKKIEKAEAAFDKMMEKVKKPSSKHFAGLLKVYANNKKLAKGKELVKRMAESGCSVGPLTWDALVKLYVGAGEVEKADSILEKATKQKKGRPLFNSYFTILDHYAKRGDIHNAEKIFQKMRQAGYVSRLKQYQTLLQAYINGKVPVYGFSDRMKADNVFPNKVMAGQLARVDAFKKTPLSELLD
ncbi:hypothetical protein RD792_012674 [Penstemon davidsonii]|uniref:PROP1-like PPR domain-containing protein n=1 Tax=Penstemon davidsonii TaxID=160366 RepID=A0ABR0CZJ2_9LAMI|nr:hypothetical protein RD792_012674 [Penstemon davidsonii]